VFGHGHAARNPDGEVERPVINRDEGSTLAVSKTQARKVLDALRGHHRRFATTGHPVGRLAGRVAAGQDCGAEGRRPPPEADAGQKLEVAKSSEHASLVSGGTESSQTRRWRRQSRANPSLKPNSLLGGKIQGIFIVQALPSRKTVENRQAATVTYEEIP
jgi:hypothetical protein